jgi:DNA (cytosine-5)-methyltransferase 1
VKTFASLFSGGGLADVGAMSAGLVPLFGVEIEAKIAEWYGRNIGEHIIVAPVQDVDYSSLETPYWLHMSPPCTNASQANTEAGETELDIALAQACIRAIKALRPPMVSLENVYQYRHFESFKMICKALREEGHAVKWWHLNSANYGVAQTRKRLFLVASRVKQPQKPPVTHQKRSKVNEQQLSLFSLLPWAGWYEAIEDLLDTLPEDKFAPWQEKRLAGEYRETMLVGLQGYDGGVTKAFCHAPAFTITANDKQGPIRAFLLMTGNTQIANPTGTGIKLPEEPTNTIAANSVHARAFIVDGQANDHGKSMTVRYSDDRLITIAASQDKRPLRAYTGCRVVRMTPRALARFQSVPDTYQLPDGPKRTGLACTIVGNAVPPLLMQRLIEANL